jgi:hypothetical protein
LEGKRERKTKRRRKTNAEFAKGAEFAERREDVLAICDAVDWLPRSLRSVADAPNCGASEKSATPGSG